MYLTTASNLRYILVGDNIFPMIYYANTHIYYFDGTVANDMGNILGKKGLISADGNYLYFIINN
jgi:hypothetical protein